MLTYFQGYHTFLEYNQGHKTWDEALRSIGERTLGTRSAIWKGLGGKTGGSINPFPVIALTLSYTERFSVLARRDFEREGTYVRRDNTLYTSHQFRSNPHDDNST